MKQKFFSLGGAFYIKNNLGQDVFSVEGAAFSFGHQLTFRDLSGNELAFIRQKLLSWGPAYEIFRDGQLFTVVRKELFTFFKHVFTVDVPGPDDLVAEGDLLGLEFTFSRDGRDEAVLRRKNSFIFGLFNPFVQRNLLIINLTIDCEQSFFYNIRQGYEDPLIDELYTL